MALTENAGVNSFVIESSGVIKSTNLNHGMAPVQLPPNHQARGHL
jgi:hypothetical protein